MAVVLTQKSWGYIATCSGGTAVPVVLVNKGTYLRVSAIAAGGAASTDICTVQDADNNLPGIGAIFRGAAVVNTMDKLVPSVPLIMDGLAIGFAGATTGYCCIYLSNNT